MPYISKEIEVEVDLDDFTDDEILDELARRHLTPDIPSDPNDTQEFINKMYEKFRQHKNIDEELREFFWLTIGRNT